MSKYNLTDILEQYKIGSGWTSDFDYEGMLNAGLRTSLKDDIKVLKQIFEDFTDVNYHREAEHLSYAIDALEDGDAMEAEGKISDFHAEIRKTMEGFDMDMSDDLGAFMASKMEEKEETKLPMDEVDAVNFDMKADTEYDEGLEDIEESFDSLAKKLDKQKGIDKDEAAKIAGSIAAKKAAGAGKGPTAKQKKRMNEVRIDREVAERIEGMLSIPLKKKFLDSFMDLWQDLIEEDPFYAEDVINHLNNEMHREIDGFQAQGDRLAGIGESSDEYVDEIGEGAMQPGEADLEAGVKGNMDALNEVSMKDVVLAIVKDTNATNPEVQMYIDSLTKDIKLNGKESYSDYEIDDYIEDFKNYISDKALQEHFGRFMKDYQ